MDAWTVVGGTAPQGAVRVAGDKSITHRALLLAALAEGQSVIQRPLASGDALASRRVIEAWGAEVTGDDEAWSVRSPGLHGLRAPTAPLDCGRSGTTLRLAAGVCAGRPWTTTLTGDPQLLGRPMGRIRDPLRALGAAVTGPEDASRAPLTVAGGALRAASWSPAVASAQVKSCVLLAGLSGQVEVSVLEPMPSRDHTERLLGALGIDLVRDGRRITLRPGRLPVPFGLEVPGDASSASFLWAWAALGGDVEVREVGLNPGRTGFLRALEAMRAEVEVTDEGERGGEPVGRVRVRGAELQALEVGGGELVALVDEVPLLALVATQAQGTTRIRDAQELRHKESDRLATTARELGKLGARVRVTADGLEVEGPTPLVGAEVESHGDHRLALALTIAGAVARGRTRVRGVACHRDSFPGFPGLFRELGGALEEEEPC